MGHTLIPVHRRRRARIEAEPRALFHRDEGAEGHVDLGGLRDTAGDADAAAVALFLAAPPLVDSPKDADNGNVDETLLQPVRLPAGLAVNSEEEEETPADALADLML